MEPHNVWVKCSFGESEERCQSPLTMFISLMSIGVFMLGELKQEEATYSPDAT